MTGRTNTSFVMSKQKFFSHCACSNSFC